jgi:hypothetical protein
MKWRSFCVLTCSKGERVKENVDRIASYPTPQFRSQDPPTERNSPAAVAPPSYR